MQPADHHRRQGEQTDGFEIGRDDLQLSEEKTAYCSQQAADGPGQPVHRIDIDAGNERRLVTVGGRAHEQTQRGEAKEGREQPHADPGDSRRRQMKLGDPQRPPGQNAGRQRRHERAPLRTEHDLDSRMQHNRQRDRHHDHREHGASGQRLDQHHIDRHPESRRGRGHEGDCRGERPIERGKRGGGEIGAAHREHALREIEDLGGLEHRREAKRDEPVETAERDAAEEDLREHRAPATSCISRSRRRRRTA